MKLDELSAREREVLALVARGYTQRGIASELIISEGTVRAHVRHLREKLGARSCAQAVHLAHSLRILEGIAPSCDSPRRVTE